MEPHSRRASCEQGAETQLWVVVIDPAWRRFVPRLDALVSRAMRVADVDASDGGNPKGGCVQGVTPGGAKDQGVDPRGVSIVLADDRLVRALNARHRGRNQPTNVLTYEHPAAELVLALGVVRREAAAAGRLVAHHLAHLIVHGALHLRGHEHARAGDARRMEMAESRLLHRLGVPNPWKLTAWKHPLEAGS